MQAEITGVAASQVTKVPRHLLRPGNQLLVVDADNLLQFRAVELNRADANFAYVGSGTLASDRLVISPVTNPLAGTTVRVAGDAPAAPAEAAETAIAAKATEPQQLSEAN